MKIGINKDVIDHATQVDGLRDLREIVLEICQYHEVVFYTESEKVATKQSGVNDMLDTEEKVREFHQELTRLSEDELRTVDDSLKYSKAQAAFYGLFPLTGAFGVQFFITRSRFQYLYAAIDAGLVSSIIYSFLPHMTKSCGGCIPLGVIAIGIIILFELPILYTVSVVWSIWCIMQDKPRYGVKNRKRLLKWALSGFILAPVILTIGFTV